MASSHAIPIASSDATLSPEDRMNLAALQRRDPYICKIIETASQVALYDYDTAEDAWTSTDVEGSLFVYERLVAPRFGFTVTNRKQPKNHWEALNEHVEFQSPEDDHFLLYKNRDKIFGLWFFDQAECETIGNLARDLVARTVAENVPGQSAESATGKHGIMKDILSSSGTAQPPNNASGGDILSLLVKAQHEYNRANSVDAQTSTAASQAPPAPLEDPGVTLGPVGAASDNPRSISLSSLFANAKTQQQREQREQRERMSKAMAAAASVPPMPTAPLLGAVSLSTAEDQRRQGTEAAFVPLDKATIPGTGKGSETGANCDAIQRLTQQMKIGESQKSGSFSQMHSFVRMNSVEAGMEEPPRRRRSNSGKAKPHRNSVPSHSPPSIEKLPQLPPHFTNSYSSGIAGPSYSPPSPAVLSEKAAPSIPLLTPDAFEHSSAVMMTNGVQHKTSSVRNSFFLSDDDVLVEDNSSLDLDSEGPESGGGGGVNSHNIVGLTKEQLRSTLIHLLRTDNDFVDTIHAGYVRSLKGQRSTKK